MYVKNNFSQKEIEFFNRLGGRDSKINLTRAVKAVSALILFGILTAAISGFYLLGNPESLFWGAVGLVLLSISYLIVKSIAEGIQNGEQQPSPLYKKVFNFLVLISLTGFILALEIFAFRHLR